MVEDLVRVKAANDYYDDVHLRREGRSDATLCGLKTVGAPLPGEATCTKCRQFSTGGL